MQPMSIFEQYRWGIAIAGAAIALAAIMMWLGPQINSIGAFIGAAMLAGLVLVFFSVAIGYDK